MAGWLAILPAAKQLQPHCGAKFRGLIVVAGGVGFGAGELEADRWR